MVKIGVVGVGHLGQHHARKFLSIDGCEFIGIYDKNEARAIEIAEKLNVKYFESYEALLEDVDAIDIAATTTYHFELAKQALLSGKHVFLEKPITSELWQAEELLEIASARKLKIQVGHIERFNPVILQVEKEISDPMFVESHRLSRFHHRGTDVPVVLDLMIHDIDLILDFIHSPVGEIRASGVGILTPSIDIANARIEFENGAIANVTSSRVSMKMERKIRFFQRDSYMSMDFQAKHVTVMRKSANIMNILPQIMMGNTDFQPEELVDITNYDIVDPAKDALTLELESFVDCVNQDKKPIVDGAAGTRALKVALDIISCIQKQNKAFK